MPVNKIEGGQGENYKANPIDVKYPDGYEVGSIKQEKVVMKNKIQTFTGVVPEDQSSQEEMNRESGDDDNELEEADETETL